jgi:hypothetical protein
MKIAKFLKKNYKIFYIIVLYISGLFFAANNSYSQFFVLNDRVIVSGYVFEESTGKPLPYVNVYVKKSRIGTITDTSGHFILSAQMKDTIVFSIVGYDRNYLIINDSAKDNTKPVILFLNTKIYELKSVDIVALKKYKQLEYQIMNMKLKDDDYVYAQRNFPIKPKDISYYSRCGNSMFGVVVSPITALYDMFSKEGREKQKLYEIQKNDNLFDLIESKISCDKLAEILELSREDFNKFIDWNNFNYDFINSLNGYELVNLLKHRKYFYQNSNNKN